MLCFIIIFVSYYIRILNDTEWKRNNASSKIRKLIQTKTLSGTGIKCVFLFILLSIEDHMGQDVCETGKVLSYIFDWQVTRGINPRILD